MSKVSAIGVDGCPAGWIAVHEHGGDFDFVVEEHFEALAERFPTAFIGIDIPIGLPDKDARACDLEARKRLKPRGSTVFPAPLRAAVNASSYEEACAIREKIEGKRYSRQVWNIMPKIAEVDACLRKNDSVRGRTYEVHPELSFAHMNQESPVLHSKRTPEGQEERLGLLTLAWRREWLDAMLSKLEENYHRKDVNADDLIDAVACLWTAQRILSWQSGWVGGPEHRDAHDLPMAIYI